MMNINLLDYKCSYPSTTWTLFCYVYMALAVLGAGGRGVGVDDKFEIVEMG